MEGFYLQYEGNKYPVENPTPMMVLEIVRQQTLLSGGQYNSWVLARTHESEFALDAVDMQAHFSVMCPSFTKALKVPSKSFMNLSFKDFGECRKILKEQYWPWWGEVRKLMQISPAQADQEEKDEQG